MCASVNVSHAAETSRGRKVMGSANAGSSSMSSVRCTRDAPEEALAGFCPWPNPRTPVAINGQGLCMYLVRCEHAPQLAKACLLGGSKVSCTWAMRCHGRGAGAGALVLEVFLAAYLQAGFHQATISDIQRLCRSTAHNHLTFVSHTPHLQFVYALFLIARPLSSRS